MKGLRPHKQDFQELQSESAQSQDGFWGSSVCSILSVKGSGMTESSRPRVEVLSEKRYPQDTSRYVCAVRFRGLKGICSIALQIHSLGVRY